MPCRAVLRTAWTVGTLPSEVVRWHRRRSQEFPTKASVYLDRSTVLRVDKNHTHQSHHPAIIAPLANFVQGICNPIIPLELASESDNRSPASSLGVRVEGSATSLLSFCFPHFGELSFGRR